MLVTMKRLSLLFLAFVTICILTVFGYEYLSQMQQEKFSKEYFYPLNIEIINDVTITAIGQNQQQPIYSFFMADEETAISQAISKYWEKERQRDIPKSLWEKHWHVLYPQTRTSPIKDAETYAIMKRVYAGKFFDIQLKEETELETIYVKPNQGRLTLNDLVQGKEEFRETLATIFRESQSKGFEDIHQQILKDFDSDDWSAIPFTYEKGMIDLAKASISLSRFKDSLSPAYFTDQDWKEFEQLEESRQKMNDSADTVTITYP